MKIGLGCDKAGIELKEVIKKYLVEKGHEIVDFTPEGEEDYPDAAIKVALAIKKKTCERGILICGTGMGMAISANKVRGVRATVCHDPYSAFKSRASNNAQIMTMGALIVGTELAKTLLDIWLDAEFKGGHSARKLEKIEEIEAKYL